MTNEASSKTDKPPKYLARFPAYLVQELVELLSRTSKCAVQRDASSEKALDLLLVAYLRCNNLDNTHRQRQQVFASVLVPTLLERLRAKEDSFRRTAQALNQISREHLYEFGTDVTEEEIYAMESSNIVTSMH